MSIFTDEVDASLQEIEYERNQDAGFLGLPNNFRSTICLIFGVITNPSLLTQPLSISAKIVASWKEDNSVRTHNQQVYLSDAIITQLRSHGDKLRDLEGDQHKQQKFIDRLSNITDSVLSAAQASSSKDKLDMLALIAVSGALIYPRDPLEQAQEFIRMASQFTTTDIFVLRQLAHSQTETRALANQHDEDVNPLQRDWAAFLAGLEHLVDPVFFRSAFVRLQAMGLVERMTSGFGSPDPAYEVLDLGLTFLRYLSEHRSSTLNDQQPGCASTNAN